MSTPLPPLVEPAAELTREEVARYSRHLIIPDVGHGRAEAPEERAGAGRRRRRPRLARRCCTWPPPASARSGIVDFDVVDESNLQRQIIHGQSDIGRSKAESARDSIARDQPARRGAAARGAAGLRQRRWSSSRQYDLILDGTDNFATRYLVNDAARAARQAVRVGLDLPLRRPGHRCSGRTRPNGAGASTTATSTPSRRRPAWCRPAPRAACWACCARRSASIMVHRGDQADHRHRRAAARPADGLRRPGDDLPHDQDPQGPERRRTDHRADRLRGVLRRGVRRGRRAPRPDSTITAARAARDARRRASRLRADRRPRAGRVGDRTASRAPS